MNGTPEFIFNFQFSIFNFQFRIAFGFRSSPMLT